jgi:HTH-type transcriptional regulator/antitoxin HigA
MDATPPACIVRQVDPRAPRRSPAPGALLFAEIKARGWTARELAARLGYDVSLVWAVLDEGYPIDQEIADALSRTLGTSAELWMNLEAAYRAASVTDTE